MSREEKSSGSGAGCWIGTAVVVVLAFIGMVVFTSIFHRIDPGYVAVIVDYGAGTVDGKPHVSAITPGQWFTINPATQKLAQYPVAQQSLTMVEKINEGKVASDDSVECRDKNGIPVHVDSTVLYRVDTNHVGDLFFLKPGVPLVADGDGDIEYTVVRREVVNAVNAECGLFSYDEINGAKRVDLYDAIGKKLAANLATSYIIVDKYLGGEVRLPQAQQDAINAKVAAQQQAEQAQYLKQKADAESAAKIAAADGDRQVAIKKAEGEAEAIKIINQQLSSSPAYIQYLQATKWNGELPSTYVAGGQAPVMIPLTGTATPTPAK